MTIQHQADRRPRRRLGVLRLVLPVVLLVGLSALVLAGADRDDDFTAATARGSSPTTSGSAGADPASTLRAVRDGAVDGPLAAGTNGDLGASGTAGDRAGLPAGLGGHSHRDGVAGGVGNDDGNDGDSGREHGAGLVLTSSVEHALRPGERRTLTVTIRNGHPWPVHLLRADVRPEQPADAPGCDPSWVKVERYRHTGDDNRVVIGGRATTNLELAIELVDLVDVNQDACKGVEFPLTLSARGAEWTS